MNGILEVAVRSLVAFGLLMYIAHLLGKQTISQMTFHDFIASITLGSIAGNLTFNTSIPFRYFLVSLFIFSGVTYLSTYISLKNRNVRALFSGEPTVVIEDGKVLEDNLKKLRFTMDSLNQALRGKDVFDIIEVQYAVMEADGQLSLLKKPPYRFITRQDAAMLSRSSAFPIELVMDGKLIEKNFSQNELSKAWFFTELAKRGVSQNEIFYCVKGTNGQLYIDLYKDNLHTPLDVES
ncbi:DUF421 domain-containing protein [Ectobacillus sp. JY-23]|uniref:DUF421 domain-containing protein n=1 Tax=Ectobacillus sp. JY-23 TaxID=2933872 RepID=UPI001FF187CB|nr:DUF421 domain-containing protein [Ectobacillus sp. JY-23]UOY92495.1 DUF421 domain-containing protein [Ectobacillus sp. JY-23]